MAKRVCELCPLEDYGRGWYYCPVHACLIIHALEVDAARTAGGKHPAGTLGLSSKMRTIAQTFAWTYPELTLRAVAILTE